MEGLFNTILGWAFNFLLVYGTYQASYHYVKKEALIKVNKGLSSSVSFTNSLTCERFNDKMQLVPIPNCKTKNKK